MLEYIQSHETALLWLAIGSVVSFVGTLILVPFLVIRIPDDYFSHSRRRHAPWAQHHRIVRGLLLFLKNITGVIFVLAGILMLVLPGQGLLTIVIGIILMDFPGKFKLERWMISHQIILKSINWLRQRSKRKPLIVDH